jgi:hypothetical protein
MWEGHRRAKRSEAIRPTGPAERLPGLVPGGPLLGVVRWRPRRGRKRNSNTLMNSTSKLCPHCDGTGLGRAGFVTGTSASCPWCKGTGIELPLDPTTAGSEPPPVLSRACSLPALAKVLKKVLTMRREARDEQENQKRKGSEVGYACFGCVGVALDEILKHIAEVMEEEPEGNTEVSQGDDKT